MDVGVKWLDWWKAGFTSDWHDLDFRSENHYETVGDSGSNYQMNTMDVRIKITQEIIKESDQFSEDSHPGETAQSLDGQSNIPSRSVQWRLCRGGAGHKIWYQEESQEFQEEMFG